MFAQEILDLLPHRPPMLLINEVVSLSQSQSEALVTLKDQPPFSSRSESVPAWVGLEYMGQTAALIAGYQQREGYCEPHLGFLLGCRNYTTNVSQFELGTPLLISAEQATVVGESLATFKCTIANFETRTQYAQALLSVFRQPLREITSQV